jgi:hypothetical protein
MAASGGFEDADDLPDLDSFRIRFGAEAADDQASTLDTDGDGGGYSWMQD